MLFMEESAGYQRILEKGKNIGLKEARNIGIREVALLLLKEKFLH